MLHYKLTSSILAAVKSLTCEFRLTYVNLNPQSNISRVHNNTYAVVGLFLHIQGNKC